MRWGLVVLVLWVWPAAVLRAQDSVLSFRDLPLGSPQSAMHARFPWRCADLPADPRINPFLAERTCTPTDFGTFAGAHVRHFTLYYWHGQLALVRIVTRAASFSQILEALTERYGPPLVSQTDTLRDRMDGWLPGASYRWERAAGAIMATEYSTSFEDSEIQYRLRAWEDANLAARRRRLLANAQDM